MSQAGSWDANGEGGQSEAKMAVTSHEAGKEARPVLSGGNSLEAAQLQCLSHFYGPQQSPN